MPNLVYQTLHVVGQKTDIDAFIRAGFVRARRKDTNDELVFAKLCPLTRADTKDTYTHKSGVVLIHSRTRTQALFAFITSWVYPTVFYQRIPRYWPQLSFACVVDEDMGNFGGAIWVMGGEVWNCVRDLDMDYDRRGHLREMRVAAKRWTSFLVEDRHWRLLPDEPWENKYMPFDAHFDEDFWFYFKTAEEAAAFKARYKSRYVMRYVDGPWRRARLRS